MKKFTGLFILFSLINCINLFAAPKLSSLPAARATIFLDFDGHNIVASIWNGGDPLNCAASGMNDTQVAEIFNRVAEDYRPFDVNVTTDSTVFLAAPLTKRIRIIITTTNAWYPGVGGTAFVGSFTWGDDTPAFVFSNKLGPFNPKIVAEACSHESGHTVGLSHQSKYDGNCTLTATYNEGNGSGEIGWAPIMGNSYYKNHTGWSNGPTPGGCNSLQDNLTIITTRNGFTYRPDEHGNEPNDGSTAILINNNSFSTSGIIGTTGDKDVFRLDVPQTGLVHFEAHPFSVGTNDDGADLDIKVTLLNSFFQPVSVYNPADLLNVAFDTTLPEGRYYVVIDGTGNSYSTNYGSLGSYDIAGTFTSFYALPIENIALTGKADHSKHKLTWNLPAGENIQSSRIETSAGGVYFNTLALLGQGAQSFSYPTLSVGDIFYRIRFTLVSGKTIYSNVVVLKSGGGTQKSFTLSTLVHDEIVVNAIKNYQYMLYDVSGRIIAKGASSAGIKKINIKNNGDGILMIRIISRDEKITERIIRQ